MPAAVSGDEATLEPTEPLNGEDSSPGPLPGVMELDGCIAASHAVSQDEHVTSQGWEAILNEDGTGTNGSSELNIEQEGTALTLRAFAPGEYAYAIYGQDVGAVMKPLKTLIDSAVCKFGGGRDDDIPACYLVGVADYSIGSWRWFGPFVDVDVIVQVNTETLKSRFKSPSDRFYLVVLAVNGSKAASALSADGFVGDWPLAYAAKATSQEGDDPGGLTIEEICTWVAEDLLTAPAMVTGLVALPDGYGVTLAWEPNPDPDVYMYQVFRQDAETDGPATLLGGVIAPEVTYFDDTGEFYKVYLYGVRALNVNQELTSGISWTEAVRHWAPIAVLHAEPHCGDPPLTVNFDASGSYVPDATIVRHEWDLEGDGVFDYDSASEATAQHTYDCAGLYNAAVRITDSLGGWDTETVGITVGGWVHTWGGSDYDDGFAVATDGNGNVYAVGTTSSFGAGLTDVILLKYDGTGNLLWQKTWGGTDGDDGNSLAVDDGGNIYVTGYTESFGAVELKGDVILLKYDSSGNLLWQKRWRGSDRDCGIGVAVDGSGNVYVAGSTRSFGAGELDVLVLKYRSDGTLLWQKTWGGSWYDSGHGVTVDGSGNICVVGYTGSFCSDPDDFYDALLLKYSPAGVLLWQKTWGGSDSESDSFDALFIDGSGNIYAAGETFTYGAGYDVLLLKYSSSGDLLWQKTWGGSSEDYGSGVAVDGSGNICLTGDTDSFQHLYDVVFLKYSPSGNLLWEKTWGRNDSWLWNRSVAVDESGRLYVAGSAANVYGSWGTPDGTETSPVGTETSLVGVAGSAAGTDTSPSGTETEPAGVEDEGGGDDDVLLMKLDPSLW